VLRAVERAALSRQGRTFTVLMARQMGKNELSAHLEARLLYLHAASGGAIVKTAPTFRPQLINSKARLERQLARFPRAIPRRGRYGYILEVGAASIHFLSADDDANVVGATASILLEVDEAQEVSEDKYLRDFRPMGATTNVTTVLYGTAWTDDTLLARQIAANLRDDPDAHFEFPWLILAELEPDYQRLVGISHKTAKADIANLVAQDLVVPIGAGRTRRYAPSSTLFGARLPVTDRPLIRITIEHLTITPLARRA
jgi:hypothetical protein